jgi:hypothetical protein
MICLVDTGLYLSDHRKCLSGVLPSVFKDDNGVFCFSGTKKKQMDIYKLNYTSKIHITSTASLGFLVKDLNELS